MADNPGSLGGLGGFTGLRGYTQSLFQNMLGRDATPDEYSYWDTNGTNASQMASTLGAGSEYMAHEIPLLYQNYLGRDSDQSVLDYYLNSGLKLGDIADQLQNTQESKDYFARLPQPTPANGQDFSVDAPFWKSLDFGPQTGPGARASTLMDFMTRAFEGMHAANPAAAAAGLIGGFGVEDPTLDPNQMEVDDNGNPKPNAGEGIAQWTFQPRKDALHQFQQNNPNMDPFEQQGRFALKDLTENPDYLGALRKLLNAKDVAGARDAALDFEQPRGWKPGSVKTSAGYPDRLANAYALQSMIQMGPPTSDQMARFFQMQGNAAPGSQWKSQVPTPPVRSDFDLNTTPMVSVTDPRTDFVNAALASAQGFTANPAQFTTIGGYNGINSALINAGFNVGASNTYGVPAAFNPLGNGTSPAFLNGNNSGFGTETGSGLQMLTIPNIGNGQ
jgi:hypothetical protein